MASGRWLFRLSHDNDRQRVLQTQIDSNIKSCGAFSHISSGKVGRASLPFLKRMVDPSKNAIVSASPKGYDDAKMHGSANRLT